jgi:hypothetical protein
MIHILTEDSMREDVLIDRFWWHRFKEAYSDIICSKYVSSLDIKRAKVSPDHSLQYFMNANEATKQAAYPSLVINMDECGFIKRFEKDHIKKVIFCKDCPVPPRFAETQESHHFTIVGAISADCTPLKPMLISIRKTLPRDLLHSPLIETIEYRYSSTGYINQGLFIEWIESILKPYLMQKRKENELPEDAPALLIMDNASVHLSDLSTLILEEIHCKLLFLVPNSTHLTQPLDLCIFGLLKKLYRNTTSNHKGLEEKFSKKANHIMECWRAATSSMSIWGAWRKACFHCSPDESGMISSLHVNRTRVLKLLRKINPSFEEGIVDLSDPPSAI